MGNKSSKKNKKSATVKAKELANDKMALVVNRMVTSIQESIDSTGTAKLPWQKPWNGISMIPVRSTGEKFTGGNMMVLALTEMFVGYPTGLWFTVNQLNEWVNQKNKDITDETLKKNAHVRKGEQAWYAFRPSIKKFNVEVETDNGKEEQERSYTTYWAYPIFNIAQFELVNISLEDFNETQIKDFQVIGDIETIVDNAPVCKIVEGFAACYRPERDEIEMPSRKNFRSEVEYYSTLAHEMVHATGHPTRLARGTIGELKGANIEEYSFEELVAELGAMLLLQMANIQVPEDTYNNSIAYLKGWMSKLQENPDWLFKAGRDAQHAVDYIINGKEAHKSLEATLAEIEVAS